MKSTVPCEFGEKSRGKELLETSGGGGDLAPDANLVALAHEIGATINSKDADFARLPEVRWVNPLAG